MDLPFSYPHLSSPGSCKILIQTSPRKSTKYLEKTSSKLFSIKINTILLNIWMPQISNKLHTRWSQWIFFRKM